MTRPRHAEFGGSSPTLGGVGLRLAVLLVDEVGAADDVVQDVFARLLGADPATEIGYGYLRVAVVNECRSVLRGRRRRLGLWQRAAALAPRETDQPGTAPGDEPDDAARVRAAVRCLPPRQRQVVVLRFYEDLSVAETAAALGISAGAVSVNAHLALRRIGSELRRDS